MRIMEIVSGPGLNGATGACVAWSRALQDRGHEVTVVCRPESWVSRQLEGTGIEVIHSDLHRWPLDELRRVARLARERSIDVLQTHNSRGSFFGVLLRRFFGVRCVGTAHALLLQPHWRFNDRVVAVSHAAKRFHHRVNLVPKRRIDVVHNFIDASRFDGASPEARARTRASLGLSPSALVMGQIGTVERRKGLLYLTRALPAVLAKYPAAKLLVVGREDGDYGRRVRGEAAKLGVADAIVWMGQRGDVSEIMGAIDVCVLSSLEEAGAPIAVLEAMASRLPIVASSVGGIPECVVDGENGRLVRRRKVAELAAALIDVLADGKERRRMGEAGRRIVRDRFSLASQMPLLEASLERAARRA